MEATCFSETSVDFQRTTGRYISYDRTLKKQWDSVEKTRRAKLGTEGKIIENVSNFNYLGYLISNNDNDISIKLQRFNKINGKIKGQFGKHMTTETKLRMHNTTSKASLW
jgi:bisphosphoglycerate-independent phosphoglycerate mutase (AlkP superfamily)